MIERLRFIGYIRRLTAWKKVCVGLTLVLTGCLAAFPCTSGLFGAGVTRDGRPLLWKHRDTSAVDNKVEYIPAALPGELSFVALFNAADRDCREAWAGFNEAGFAVMNTASYNIKDDDVPEKDMDKEGLLMAIALRHCRSVDDFAQLLDTLPRPLGVEANFGVFDADGHGAYFETNNDSYRRFSLKDDNDWIIRTNYSHGGRPNEGYGFVREANALHLLKPYAEKGEVSPELLTESVSRSFYHSMFGCDMLEQPGQKWTVDQDFIPRYKSSAVVVIEGVPPGESPSRYVMWTGLGYPPCAEILPVECSEQGVDPRLRGLAANGHSQMSDRAKARRDEVFPIHYGNGDKYISLTRLRNDEGTGYLQVLVPQNMEVYEKYRKLHRKDGSNRSDDRDAGNDD